MGEIRDAARTRNKILEAARDEFAAHGFAGARIDSVARRAGLSKQLLYHYFASKEALFEETLESKYHQHRVTALSTGDGPGAAFRQRFLAAARDPQWVRFLTWEAAEHQSPGPIVAEGPRREAIKRQRAAIADRQVRGDLPGDLPIELIQLAVYALATYPLAFSQVTEMVTGKSPADPEFQSAWTAFLDELASRLAHP